MRNLRAAIIFLTRIPVGLGGKSDGAEPPSLTAAVPWFPVVGALVGAAVGGTAAGLLHIRPPFVAAGVAVVLGVLITGAFHEDGLADVADAFAGGWTEADRLRILKDPLHGSYGVAALCSSIVIRIVCVGSLGVQPAVAFAVVVAAHALGRTAAVVLMSTTATARPDGLGADYARTLSRRRASVGAAAGVAVAAIVTGWWVGPFALAAIVAIVIVGWLAKRKIGGVTGDVLGTVEQVAECLVLIVATGLASRYHLWWSR
ncbi:MAG: cobS [Ilumatobacteraceae bacterium]|nr:cobS [Ilumatobacteraceae bacterium]